MGIIGQYIDIQPTNDGIMTEAPGEKAMPVFTLESFQPRPDMLYSLDLTAHLAGVSRRSLLIYCRRGLVQPLFQPPNQMMMFTDKTIYTVRKVEHLRAIHDNDLGSVK
jgi:hypothetical protein